MNDTKVDKLTPPPELVQQIRAGALHRYGQLDYELQMIHAAYRAGADTELDACVEWVQGYAECGDSLRAARRPKPPSLPLSPAAQAVLMAVNNVAESPDTEAMAAAALRAAAAQLTSAKAIDKLRAIAAELEGSNG